MSVRFVDIDGIFTHHCLIFLFIIGISNSNLLKQYFIFSAPLLSQKNHK